MCWQHIGKDRRARHWHPFVASVRERSPGLVLGVGIGCKGVIDAATTRVNRLPGDLHFMEGQTLREMADVVDVPGARADNDARTALVAEVLWCAPGPGAMLYS